MKNLAKQVFGTTSLNAGETHVVLYSLAQNGMGLSFWTILDL